VSTVILDGEAFRDVTSGDCWRNANAFDWARVSVERVDPAFGKWALGEGKVSSGPDGLVFVRGRRSSDRPAFDINFLAYSAYDPIDDVGVWLACVPKSGVSA
jgi:hypothetical protein